MTETSQANNEFQLPEGKDPTLRMQPGPNDVNMHGDVFGGWIMAQVDIAGGIAAARRAKGRVATIAVNSFLFKQAVFVGDVLSFYCEVVKVGNTSIQINVEVFAERSPKRLHVGDPDVIKVTEALLTYVATDENRKPRQVPQGWLGIQEVASKA
jgi:acyl-CoA thioesterase YciA